MGRRKTSRLPGGHIIARDHAWSEANFAQNVTEDFTMAMRGWQAVRTTGRRIGAGFPV
jgi:hypothetical protein